MIPKIPIAWLQITYQKSRLLVTVLGVTFAVLLMFIQLAFRDGLFENSVTMHKAIQADLVLLHADTNYFFGIKEFPRNYLYRVLEINGVASASPFYFADANFKNTENFVTETISVCAFRPDEPVLNLSAVNQSLKILQQPNAVLFDELSSGEYGSVASEVKNKGVITTELSNKKINIVGLFSLGGGVMSQDGLVVTSDLNYSTILNMPLEKVAIGVIRLEQGIKPEEIIKQFSQKFAKSDNAIPVKLITLNKFMELEKQHWAESTPIGFIFNLGTVIGLVFGGVIVYQILYSQIADNLYIYATFKAIGYSKSYLVSIIIQQAVLMSLMGYIPGFVLCMFLYQFVQDATRLPMFMTFSRALIVLLLTITMCSLAGLLAMKKLQSADPADLFR
ncbi:MULTISPECIES: ABC transporter permease DevC [Nostoc]|uniref:FtsX-like permease family protein n=1 Tax=Nostoc paludosum FACHB-159 TaxID=2692908 RepID=A0ABR8KHV5_9NOSO|nr:MULTISPECIES: ABC transporter permease DevC [Nostoc]MBD2682795.1 FtsX-like permease family protein [Nostoc sp. FACHB-857]MBD2739130.1 FtsX-like permease family protein [Nostoc paludosum FACHB-159]